MNKEDSEHILTQAEKLISDMKVKALKDTTSYLYSLDDSCPKELRQSIDILRQLINEEYVAKNKTISSQLIWDIIKGEILVPILDLLDDYSRFLQKRGYLDSDWYTEEPFIINEYIAQLKGKE